MTSPGARGADGAALLAGAGAGVASTGRGRGVTAGMLSVTAGLTGTGAPLNIGAGCDPDCMNNTLIRIATVAQVPAAKATASRELHPSARNMRGLPSTPSSTALARPARDGRLRTFLHRNVGRRIGCAQREPLDHGRPAATAKMFARQIKGDPRAFAEPAGDEARWRAPVSASCCAD